MNVTVNSIPADPSKTPKSRAAKPPRTPAQEFALQRQPFSQAETEMNFALSKEVVQARGQSNAAIAKDFVRKYKAHVAAIRSVADLVAERSDKKGQARIRAVLRELDRQVVEPIQSARTPPR